MKFIVNRWQAVFVFAFLIIVMGLTAYFQLPRESSPEIKQPKIFINTLYMGVAAADIEQLVTKVIEEEIEGTEGVKDIFSTSKLGLSSITVDFNSEVEVEVALRRIREKVDIAKAEIPSDAEEPMVKELNFSDQPIFIAVLSNPGGLEVIEGTADRLEEKFKRVGGVLDVNIAGKLEKEVAITVNPGRMKHFGLNFGDIQKAINDEHKTIPGGELKSTSTKFVLSVTGEIKDPDQFESILIKNKDKVFRLGDFADVSFKYKDPETISRINSTPSISLSVTKRSGENLLRIAEELKQIIQDDMKHFPDGTEYSYSYDESRNIKNMVSDLENNILSGLVLVFAVTFFFLGFYNALFVGLAIPFSMLISFFVLQMAGITLNMVVLFSLVLALGMLVDNGIVIVENIYRHTTLGKSVAEASIYGTKEVAMPIIASTATTILAFFPIIFMPGIMGEFMAFIPKTVIIVLSSSLFVGLTLNPVFCSRFLKPQEKDINQGGQAFTRFQNAYMTILDWALRRPILTLIVAFASVFSSFFAYGALGTEPVFFPQTDPEVGIIEIETAQGSPVAITDSIVSNIETQIPLMKNNPSLDNFQTTIGRGSGQGVQGNESHKATIRLGYKTFTEKDQLGIWGKSTQEEAKRMLEQFTGASILVTEIAGGPPTGHDVSYEVTGEDYAVAGDIAQQVKRIIGQYDEFKLVDFDYEEGKPEIRIEIDREKAIRLGVRTAQVAHTIRQAMHGGILGKFREGKEEYDIVARYQEEYRNEIPDLQTLEIVHEGNRIPLSSIASIKQQAGPGVIKRKNLKRTIEIFGDFNTDIETKEQIKIDIERQIQAVSVPPGYRLGPGEGAAVQTEAVVFLLQAFGVAVFLILILLIIQFNSISQPAIIMASVFLSLGGVFWGLTLMQDTFVQIMSGIGIISLAGVVVNNAIVLIDYTNLLVKQGLSPLEAIRQAGKTRLRPVLLTAITTVLGLLPMAAGVGFDFFSFSIVWASESAVFWEAMAKSVIYGLIFATMMTLIVVPALLLLDYRLQNWWGRQGRQKV